MIKVFGSHTCNGCIVLEAELKKKKVPYEFYNIREPEGLAELAAHGLADELSIPIVLDENGDKVQDLNAFIERLKNV